MMLGRLSDGRTARVVEVEVSLDPDGLRLAPIGGDPALPSEVLFWPYAITRLVDGGAQLRFTRSDDPDARLVAPGELRAALTARAPQTLKKPGQSRATRALIVGGIGLMVAVLAGVLIGIPLAAGPLAQATSPRLEARLGDLAESQLSRAMPACEGPAAEAALAALAPLAQRLEAAVGVDQTVQYVFVDEDLPNALALPGAQVWITRGLLEAMDQPDAFAAVVAHELGHVKARDGLEAFYRRAGVGVMLDVLTGGSGMGQQVILLSGDLAELGYTRNQEGRADRVALEAMDQAGYDPGALARAFIAIEAGLEEEREAARKEDGGEAEGEAEDGGWRLPGWLSTHPDTAARIAAAKSAAKPNRPQPLDPTAWARVRGACGGS